MSAKMNWLAALAFTGLLAAAPMALAATAEPRDIDPETLATLAKEKSKATAIRPRRSIQAKQLMDPEECGSIAIGNVNTGKRIGFQPREVNVIITGDVINANNNCK